MPPRHHAVPTAPSPFGSCTLSVSLGGLLLTENRYQPHAELALHHHADPYLCIVLGGAYDETSRSRRMSLREGVLLSHAQDSEHANRFSAAGASCLNVTPTGAWRDNFLWAGLDIARTDAVRETPRDALLRLRLELAQPEEAGALGVAAALFDLLHRTGTAAGTGAPPPWLRRVRDRLEAGFNPGSLEALAADAGVHPSHLARAFRQWQGVSIGEYLRRRRLQHTLRALARGTMPLSELAVDAGYTDQAHMTRAIRQATGQTPRAYGAAMQGRYKSASAMQDRARGDGPD